MPTAHHQELSGGERTTDPVCLCQLSRPPSQEYIHLPPNLKHFKHCSSCLGLRRHQGERHQETQNVNVAMHCHLAKVDVFSLGLVRGSCLLPTARALGKPVMQLEPHTPKQKGSVAEKKTLPHIRGQEQTPSGDWGSGSRYRACVKCTTPQVQSQYYQRRMGGGVGEGGVNTFFCRERKQS